MRIMRKIIFVALVSMMTLVSAAGQESTVNAIESLGGCGLVTDCENDVICIDIELSVDIMKDLDSYNIFVQYDGTVLSRKDLAPNDASGQGDNTCVIANGIQDTDLEDAVTPSKWRVAGVPGSPFPMTANTPVIVHTICFLILDPAAVIAGTEVCVGGDEFGGALRTTVTYSDATFDDNVPQTCFQIDANFTTCVLPVEYLSFTGSKKGTSTELEWETATEINNDYFNVETSLDGKNWMTIGKVKGTNSEDGSKYNYLHEDPSVGVNYYRLKQVDLDGSSEYSNVISVKFESESKLTTRIFPSPAKEFVNLSIEAEDGDKVKVNILDPTGKLIRENVVDTELKGESEEFRIPMIGIDAGIYLFRIDVNGTIINKKVLLID